MKQADSFFFFTFRWVWNGSTLESPSPTPWKNPTPELTEWMLLEWPHNLNFAEKY